MITPDQIREKAERLYHQVIKAWLAGDESFFPRTIPASKSLEDADLPAAIKSVQRLRSASREALGYGYSIEWEVRRSRRFGQNGFPRRIFFETANDLLRLIGREREFAAFQAGVGKLRAAFDDLLDDWMPSNVRLLSENLPDVDGLIAVVRYFLDHPQPTLFAREFPLVVATKFVERHQSILRQWLDRLLPPNAIRADEIQFERRYGLRDKEPFLILRSLDPAIQAELHLIAPDIALPLSALATLPVRSATLFVIENRVPLRTFPPVSRGLALEGRGCAVTELRDVPWLAENQLYYWGDMDVEGFAILNSLRSLFPRARSLLMDADSFDALVALAISGTDRVSASTAHLTATELQAFTRCCDAQLRIEQERISQSEVRRAVTQRVDEFAG